MADENGMVGEVYYPAPEVVQQAHIKDYEQVHAAATKDLAGFWHKIAAEDFEWYKPWQKVLDDHNAPFYKWFVGAKVNIVHNALDRHMRTPTRNKAALIFMPSLPIVRAVSLSSITREMSCIPTPLLKRCL